MKRAIILLLLCTLLSIAAGAAALSLRDETASAGQTAPGSVSFASEGAAVSGIQFDVVSDSVASIRALPGAALGVSAKVLYVSAIPNGARVVLVGMNGDALPEGELVRPLLSISPDAHSGAAALRLENVIATAPDGSPVAVRATPGTLRIQDPTTTATFAPTLVVNAASLRPGPICPGEMITIFGGPALGAASTLRFNGTPAPIVYTGSGQINAVVPFGIAPDTTVTLDIGAADQSLGTTSLSVTPAAPAIFALSGSGSGPGAILNEDTTVNSWDHPATVGSVVTIFATGLGAYNPSPDDGSAPDAPASAVLPVSATVAGVAADVTYAGVAPGLIAGAAQINIRVPPIAANSAATVMLTVGGVSTPASIWLAVR